jgi:hypothetical protein
MTAENTHMGRRSQIASTPKDLMAPKDFLGFSNFSQQTDFHPLISPISQRISVGSSRMSKLACH